jgi:hypothetical protein
MGKNDGCNRGNAFINGSIERFAPAIRSNKRALASIKSYPTKVMNLADNPTEFLS